jgi:hypothetical protein
MLRKMFFWVFVMVSLLVVVAGRVQASGSYEPFFPAVYAVNDGTEDGLGILSNQPVLVDGVLVEEVREIEGKNLYFWPADSGQYTVTYETTDYLVEVSFYGPDGLYEDAETGFTWRANSEWWGTLGVVKYLTPIIEDHVVFSVVGWGFEAFPPEGTEWWLWDYEGTVWEESDNWGFYNLVKIFPFVPPEEPEMPDCSMVFTEPIAPFAYVLYDYQALGLNVKGTVHGDVASLEEEIEEKTLYLYPIEEEGVYPLGCGTEAPETDVEANFVLNGTEYSDGIIRVQAAQGDWANLGVARYIQQDPFEDSIVYGITGGGYELVWPWPEGILWWDFSQESWTADQVWGYFTIIKIPFQDPTPPGPPPGPDPEPDPDPEPEGSVIFLPLVLKNHPKEPDCLKTAAVEISVWSTSEGLGVCSQDRPYVEGSDVSAVLLPDDYGHTDRYNWIFPELSSPGEYRVYNNAIEIYVKTAWVPAGQTFAGQYISFGPRSSPIGVIEYVQPAGNKYVYAIYGFDFEMTPVNWGYPIYYWNGSTWQVSPLWGEFNTVGIVPK